MRGKAVIAGDGHTAYGKHSGRDKIGLIVELAKGPRVMTNIVEPLARRQLEISAAVELIVEYEGEQVLARFRLST